MLLLKNMIQIQIDPVSDTSIQEFGYDSDQ